jgi:hypothetical protein
MRTDTRMLGMSTPGFATYLAGLSFGKNLAYSWMGWYSARLGNRSLEEYLRESYSSGTEVVDVKVVLSDGTNASCPHELAQITRGVQI